MRDDQHLPNTGTQSNNQTPTSPPTGLADQKLPLPQTSPVPVPPGMKEYVMQMLNRYLRQPLMPCSWGVEEIDTVSTPVLWTLTTLVDKEESLNKLRDALISAFKKVFDSPTMYQLSIEADWAKQLPSASKDAKSTTDTCVCRIVLKVFIDWETVWPLAESSMSINTHSFFSVSQEEKEHYAKLQLLPEEAEVLKSKLYTLTDRRQCLLAGLQLVLNPPDSGSMRCLQWDSDRECPTYRAYDPQQDESQRPLDALQILSSNDVFFSCDDAALGAINSELPDLRQGGGCYITCSRKHRSDTDLVYIESDDWNGLIRYLARQPIVASKSILKDEVAAREKILGFTA